MYYLGKLQIQAFAKFLFCLLHLVKECLTMEVKKMIKSQKYLYGLWIQSSTLDRPFGKNLNHDNSGHQPPPTLTENTRNWILSFPGTTTLTPSVNPEHKSREPHAKKLLISTLEPITEKSD
ncbi:hypothetical protein PanWU01x14_304240, partial [Parasponia andersonii]